jgi:hypothetical protein
VKVGFSCGSSILFDGNSIVDLEKKKYNFVLPSIIIRLKEQSRADTIKFSWCMTTLHVFGLALAGIDYICIRFSLDAMAGAVAH